MTLVYSEAEQLYRIDGLFDAYFTWHTKLMRSLFYPGKEAGMSVLEIPSAINDWADEHRGQKYYPAEQMEALLKLHNDIAAQAQAMLAQSSVSKAAPDYERFKGFCFLFEQFIELLSRLEKDGARSRGFDPETGLRTIEIMPWCLGREMDRLERGGKTFAIALLRADDYLSFIKQKDRLSARIVVQKVADMIKKSLRSFDDAYVLEDGLFVLALKQTEAGGGMRALERLREELDKHNKNENIGLSSCVAEPVPDEDIMVLIENLKSELRSHDFDGASVMEYTELTPLQRYMKDKSESG